ncbi:conserved hypothetical protein [Beutenbergia cavernae DSM 12333]|uniref:DUF3052 domain-containing protein n=1 Tax=Beutenbergia cavernae (strain ATCC BAA-8 / DSM 12333 / CCUG 43141 / JCM 11478 / NBRC 16432 / NCIMB 13614 / HKI 0122) TaxID=471853 RepID=C5C4T9_BEUC1|nr:DUF3052 domain-containing protein [Beutenbergia cavernae]ACQ80067.1 conserved hypothetical protein [Beutenbergia cavernae DSM 12333]
MAASTDPGATRGAPDRFGFTSGQVIQEFGYDDDVDLGLRDALAAVTGTDLVDEDYDDVTDSAIVWWREEDGDVADLADLLITAMSALDDGGLVWVLVPKAGRPGHVTPADIADAAQTAGLQPTTSIAAAPEWLGVRLAARGRGR